jgi:hypothetical protein
MGVVASQIHVLAETRLVVSPGVQAAVVVPPELLTELPPTLAVLPPDLPEFPPDPPPLADLPPWLPPDDWVSPPSPAFPGPTPFAQPPMSSSVRSVHRESLSIEGLLRIAGFARLDRISLGCHSLPAKPTVQGRQTGALPALGRAPGASLSDSLASRGRLLARRSSNPFRVPMIASAKAGFARRSQSAGGVGEAERSERGGGGGWGAEGRSEPFQGSHLKKWCSRGNWRSS